MVNIRRYFVFSAFLLMTLSISAQITVKELPPKNLQNVDSLFFNISESRKIVSLRDGWKIYPPNTPEKKVNVTIPSTFSGVENLVYEKSIFISSNQIKNKNLTLHFLGINYTADVLFNDMVIYKHPGGIQPFDINIPHDIINPDTKNKLTVKVQYELDDVSTIPVLQRFLFPKSNGGIIGDVYLIESSNLFIGNLKTDTELASNFTSAKLKVETLIQNNKKRKSQSENELEKTYKLNYVLNNFSSEYSFSKIITGLPKNESVETSFEIEVPSPLLWSPGNPNLYILNIELTVNDSVIDRTAKSISFYNSAINSNALKINGNDFEIKGTTYFYSENESGGLVSYDKLHEDLELIKETGFNTIRFSKIFPPVYALHLCETLGLFALVELPLNSIPEQILTDSDFTNRVANYTNLMVEQYSQYSSVLGFGLGGGYIGASSDQLDFLTYQAQHLKEKTNRLTYASFISLAKNKIGALDLCGIELFSPDETQLNQKNTELGNYNYAIFISEATYPSFNGNSNGYLNKNSYEAAAKFYTDVIDFSASKKLNGFVLNTFYDYKGEFKSFYTGYNEDYTYSIGLLPDAGTIDRISYKVVKSKLTDAEKITIPIGAPKDDSPILFVIIGLGLSIFMALLINSKRKFREDAGRALIRPYNFFADIRDHRLLSGFQTNLLMFILAGSLSLLVINVLHFLRSNILLEKLLLSFGSVSLIDSIIYLSWHPLNGFIILFFASIITFVILSLIIKAFSLFLKNKVFFSSVYYSVIWALLPLSLLLPLELVLYRVLAAEMINLYIYVFIIIYLLWLGQRLLKGIHVIFDVRPSTVHLYGILLIVIFTGGILLFYQLTNSTVYHLLRAVSEYKFL